MSTIEKIELAALSFLTVYFSIAAIGGSGVSLFLAPTLLLCTIVYIVSLKKKKAQ